MEQKRSLLLLLLKIEYTSFDYILFYLEIIVFCVHGGLETITLSSIFQVNLILKEQLRNRNTSFFFFLFATNTFAGHQVLLIYK